MLVFMSIWSVIHCGGKGFDAIKGWDPVTGLGTPNYAAMAKAVLALP